MDSISGLQSWGQAFEEFSVPTTRTIEKQLRASVSRDREKLRSLVGGNYRELLATAEEIVSLEDRTKSTESRISTITRGCKPPDYQNEPPSTAARRAIIAQLRLLQRSCSASSKALTIGSTLCCAELIVIARLLLKSLSDQQPLINSLNVFRNKISSLRQQLLRHIDGKISKPKAPTTQLLEASCAYCLITSSSSNDAIEHVQHIRLGKLRQNLETLSTGRSRIIECLHYHLTSLHILKGLLGRALNDMVGALQKQPIFEDEKLRALEHLNLVELEKLIPQDIRTFTPYFKRTLLSTAEARDILDSWSREGYQAFLKGLNLYLPTEGSISEILALRREIFSTLLPVYFTAFLKKETHEKIQQSLNARIEEICQQKVKGLNTFTTKLLDLNVINTKVGSPWQSEVVNMPLTNGAGAFLDQIKRRHTGTSRALSNVLRSLQSWVSSVVAMQSAFESVQSIRWQDMIEEPDDEQEDLVTSITTSLSKHDNRFYEQCVQKALDEALAEYEIAVCSRVTKVIDDPRILEDTVSLLRSVRQSASLLRRAYPSKTSFTRLDGEIMKLYQVVAEEVLRRLSDSAQQKTSISAAASSNLAMPENIPTPRAFLTLRNLCTILSDVGGTDLWSTSGIKVVKSTAANTIFAEDSRSWYMQTVLDEAYLRVALNYSSETVSTITDGNTSKAANDHWSRTKLLFGLLA